MSDIVQKVLAADAAARVPGKTTDDDLFSINDLEPQLWNFSLPTLTSQNSTTESFMVRRMDITTTLGFEEVLFGKYPTLRHIDWSNLVLAGGCVGRIITGGSLSSGNDLDFFIYGLSPQDAEVKLNQVCEVFVKNEQLKLYRKKMQSGAQNNNKRTARKVAVSKPVRKIVSNSNATAIDPDDITIDSLPNNIDELFPEETLGMSFVRTKNTLTIDGKFQFIFRLYRNVSEVLHGFDLGSSAVGYDGTNVCLSGLGKFAYEYGYLIVDTTRRSTTYETRIQKYMGRGFGLIMPQLDITKLSTKLCEEYNLPEVCQLPYLVFTYSARDENRITLSRFYNRMYSDSDARSPQHDYDIYAGTDDMFGLYYQNIRYIVNNEFDKIIYTSNDHRKVLGDVSETISMVLINYFYKGLRRRIVSSEFPTRSVEKYITVVKPEEIFAHRNDAAMIQELIGNQLEFIQAQLEKLNSTACNIPWVTDQPGTQLTSSFNPIIEDPAEWYADYYVD